MFFTDHSFAKEEKIETGNKVYLTAQRRTKQVEQERQSHLDEVELKKQPQEQYHQQYF